MRLLLFLWLLALAWPAAATEVSSAYEALRSHGLPIGILPKGVRDFAMDDDGRFEARLDTPCIANFESEMRYNASVAGTISAGQIAGLTGVAAQDLFLWFPVLAIRLDNQTSGIIHFDVGVVDKRFPLSLFESPPDCSPDSSQPTGRATLPTRRPRRLHLKPSQSSALVSNDRKLRCTTSEGMMSEEVIDVAGKQKLTLFMENAPVNLSNRRKSEGNSLVFCDVYHLTIHSSAQAIQSKLDASLIAINANMLTWYESDSDSNDDSSETIGVWPSTVGLPTGRRPSSNHKGCLTARRKFLLACYREPLLPLLTHHWPPTGCWQASSRLPLLLTLKAWLFAASRWLSSCRTATKSCG
ncbi:hypothetical protein ZIOFF_066562 [Zingiber officinale]|uniref:Uncharacterized protein n=1 Tax=Zingiber officinale TaxID=94328 RepID=A0A8J5EYG8_ZINOF|nr:hypothetical protein ZIOFF_066562 [Zingiber officinale]